MHARKRYVIDNSADVCVFFGSRQRCRCHFRRYYHSAYQLYWHILHVDCFFLASQSIYWVFVSHMCERVSSFFGLSLKKQFLLSVKTKQKKRQHTKWKKHTFFNMHFPIAVCHLINKWIREGMRLRNRKVMHIIQHTLSCCHLINNTTKYHYNTWRVSNKIPNGV